ncbi:hypothetical protein BDA96_08G007600 [Sorghum bicolor]|jgi:hypothetical protein|uniref:Uncharacterized protein n=1 Tax=Sorghum bicolor TaxID=4558 RepID=A0A921QDC9_SORBI|nr:hypothetical protein BDA96_08G007600 [Sorghum bicolor]
MAYHIGMETFTDKLQREEPPSHEAGNNDMADLKQEDSIYADRLQREDLPSQEGNKNNGTASTPASEICEAADDMV